MCVPSTPCASMGGGVWVARLAGSARACARARAYNTAPHRLSVCHQFLTLAPVLSKSGLCGKSTVFTYEIGFLGMLRNRLWSSSRIFVKKTRKPSAV